MQEKQPVKLKVTLQSSVQYVKVISGMFPGGLTEKEKMIIVIIMELQRQYDTQVITQEIKEKTRLHLGLSAQTMHNYWHRLKHKNVIEGSYKDFKFNKLLNPHVELNIRFHNG